MPGLSPPGLFVYPTDEYTTVVGFEAVIADRVVTIQLRDKAKLDRSHLDIQSATVTGKKTSGPWRGWPGWRPLEPESLGHMARQHGTR